MPAAIPGPKDSALIDWSSRLTDLRYLCWFVLTLESLNHMLKFPFGQLSMACLQTQRKTWNAWIASRCTGLPRRSNGGYMCSGRWRALSSVSRKFPVFDQTFFKFWDAQTIKCMVRCNSIQRKQVTSQFCWKRRTCGSGDNQWRLVVEWTNEIGYWTTNVLVTKWPIYWSKSTNLGVTNYIGCFINQSVFRV